MNCWRRFHNLSEYDKRKLQDARDIILKVYEYHSGDSYMRKETKRLETLISKIDVLIQMCEN